MNSLRATFQEALDVMRKNMGIVDLTEDGKCTGCGECCSNILPISMEEVSKIRKYARKKKIKPVRHVKVPMVEPDMDMMCPFLDPKREGKCMVYEVRPAVCRTFQCRRAKEFQDGKRGLDFLDEELVSIARTPMSMRHAIFRSDGSVKRERER